MDKKEPTTLEVAALSESRLVEPVRAIRTFETAIENIIAGIERSRLRRGDRLPNETELARQLEISKPSLRQALRVLERAGLLVVKQGKSGGIFMASEYLPTEEISHNIAIEEGAVFEILSARRVIETAIANEAFVSATDDDLAEIERTIKLLEDVENPRAQVSSRADTMFHRAVARATHNRILEEAQHNLNKHLHPIRDAYQESVGNSSDMHHTVHEIHRRQLEAMKSRDADKFAVALDRHFRFLEERFAAALTRPWSDVFGTLVTTGPPGSRHQIQ